MKYFVHVRDLARNCKLHFDSHRHYQVPESLLNFPIIQPMHEISLQCSRATIEILNNDQFVSLIAKTGSWDYKFLNPRIEKLMQGLQ